MVRYLPDILREEYLNKKIYVHGISRLMNPLTMNHDFRWFFLYGLRSKYLQLDPPTGFRMALQMMESVLSMSQFELGGSQTIDHWNLLLAPYLASLTKTNRKHFGRDLDSFVLHLWQLYSTRPREPVYSSIVLDMLRPIPHIGDVVARGGSLKGDYEEFAGREEETTNCTRALLQSAYQVSRATGGLLSYPKIILKANSKWLEDADQEVLGPLLELISESTGSVPVYFAELRPRCQPVLQCCVLLRASKDPLPPRERKSQTKRWHLCVDSLACVGEH